MDRLGVGSDDRGTRTSFTRHVGLMRGVAGGVGVWGVLMVASRKEQRGESHN